MKKVVLLFLLELFIICGVTHAYDDGDFQIWNTNVQDFKIKENLKLAFEEEFRWADNANEFYYHHYDAGLFFTLDKYFSLAGGYRHIYELRNGKFKPENEPYLALALSSDYLGFSLETRNRLEYRHFDFQDDSWRYRNKFTLKSPWKFSKIQVQPYLADEIFIALGNSRDELNQNRFSSGFYLRLSEKLKAELYYMLVSAKKESGWSDANVLGIKLKISF